MTATASPPSETARREAALTALVDRWTAHMRWRKDYDRWREDRLWQEETQLKRLRLIARVAGDLTGKRVLDIGSGMGGFLVAAANNDVHAIGIEPNADYATITRLRAARYGQPPALARAVGEHLPFMDATFDVVLAQDILEHVRNPDDVLREIARVLRPGGVALVTAINRFAWRDPHYHLYGINYLPRPVADGLIALAGRTKRGAAFTDAQRLSAMYYDRYRGFVRRAGAAGLSVSDIREASISDAARTPSGLRGRIIALARRVGLAVPLYRAYRFAVLGTFEVVLRHDTAPINGDNPVVHEGATTQGEQHTRHDTPDTPMLFGVKETA